MESSNSIAYKSYANIYVRSPASKANAKAWYFTRTIYSSNVCMPDIKTQKRQYLKSSLSVTRKPVDLSSKERINNSKFLFSAPPLTRSDEVQCFNDVRDLLFLQKEKAEFESKLGRPPTYEEWANHVGCSVSRLYARIGKGRAAKRKMVEANVKLVHFVAREFHGRGLSHLDLCQEGIFGLIKSTEKFDISYNTKFSTYSYFWIRQRMSLAVQKFQHVGLMGSSVKKMIKLILQHKDEFRELNGRNPSLDELAIASGIDKMEIKQAFFAFRNKEVAGWQDRDGCNLLDNVAEEDKVDKQWMQIWRQELKAELRLLFNELTGRELQVVKMRYGLFGGTPMTLFQIAAILQVSHESVRVTQKRAISKLRKCAEEYGLQEYLYDMQKLKSY